jgi:hypothetical protein
VTWTEPRPFRPNVLVEIVGVDYAFSRRRVCDEPDAAPVVDLLVEQLHLVRHVVGFFVVAEPFGNPLRRGRVDDGAFSAVMKSTLQEIRTTASNAHSIARDLDYEEYGFGAGARYAAIRDREKQALAQLEWCFERIWGRRPTWHDQREAKRRDEGGS